MIDADLTETLDRLTKLEIGHAFEHKRIIVTGARGFLGRAFTRVFSALKAEVIALDRYSLAAEMKAAQPEQLPGVEHVDHDVTKPFPIYGRVDYVLPLAAIASPVHYAKRPLDCHDVIVQGTRNMLELAAAKGATLFLPSTSELYGDSGWGGTEMREQHLGVLDPWDVRGRAYDVPKLEAEAMTAIFAAAGVKVQAVRYFNVYGPGLSRHDYRVMSKFAAAIVDRAPLIVHGYGDFPTRSFCYVTDALVASLLVLVKGDHRPYNVGNPEEVSIRDLALGFLQAATNRDWPVQALQTVEAPAAYANQPRRRKPDITRLRSLGFEPTVDLKTGVARLLSWAAEAYKL